MDINVFSKTELEFVFRVLRTAFGSDTLNEAEKTFLTTYAKITDFVVDVEKLKPIENLEISISDPHKRKRILQLSGIGSLLHNPVRKESVDFLKKLSRTLDVKDNVVRVVEAVYLKKKMKARILTMRRGLKSFIKEAYTAEGWRGPLRFFFALFFGVRVNRDQALRYKRLGLLPEGTLGREYWKHITELGFGFPGEPAGIPSTVAYHDIGHVLADNDTTPLGEVQQGSFQGGNRREDGFFFIQFVILQFHHGIKLTPVAPPETGNFDPAKLLWAIHRGALCKTDITHQWDYWPLMSQPIDQVRKQCGLIAKL